MSVSLLHGRTVRHTLSVLVVAALLGAGVTGCSEDAGAKTENTVDASPTPANTPTDGDGASDGAEEPVENTPTEPEQRPVPEEPEAMKTGDKAGAIAAATFFVEAIEYSMHTSTTDLLEKYSYEKCSMCNEFIDVINKRNEADSQSTESVYKIIETGKPQLWGKRQIIWEVPLDLSVHEVFGKQEESYERQPQLLFYVTYFEDEWELTDIATKESAN